MMLSFLKSANASDKLRSIVDNFLLTNNLFDEAEKLKPEQSSSIKQQVDSVFHKSKLNLKRIRNWAVSSFLVGIFAFSTFVAINLAKENTVKQTNKETIIKK
jgi:hypothetical protein